MSLISIKNFAAPFSNGVHVFTIVLITILFLIFRLMGGSVNVHTTSERSSLKSDTTETFRQTLPTKLEAALENDLAPNPVVIEKKPAVRAQPRLPEKGTIQLDSDDQDLLGQMIGQKPLPEKSIPARNDANASSSKGGLDEIEKSLGLR